MRKLDSRPERRPRSSRSSGAGQIATTAATGGSADRRRVRAPGSRPCSIRAARRAACARAAASTIASTSANAVGPNSPVRAPVPARVERERRHAGAARPRGRSRSATPSPIRRRGRSRLRRSAARRAGTARRRGRRARRARGGSGVGRGVRIMGIMPAAARTLSHVYPADARLNEAGRLEIGGCDVIELAREFGTPAYVYAENDMRARAREYVEAFRARTEHFEVIYASKAFPAHRRLPAVRRGGPLVRLRLGRRAAPGAQGRLRARAHLHARQQQDRGRARATRSSSGVGTIVVDSFDEIERLERIAPEGQKVMLRVTPGIKPTTHSYIQTGQVDSKFGFAIDDVPRAIARDEGPVAVRPARAHRLADLRARGLREARRGARRASATARSSTSAAGSASPTRTTSSRRRSTSTSRRC